MPLNFVYDGNFPNLRTACGKAVTIVQGDVIWKRALTRDKNFFNATIPSKDIVRFLQECEATITVRDWEAGPDWGKTTAVVNTGMRNIIRCNNKFNKRPIPSLVNTLVHEFVHVVDYFHDGKMTPSQYTHRGQYSHKPPENQDSAPYWLGNLAEAISRGLVDIHTIADFQVPNFSAEGEEECGTVDEAEDQGNLRE